MIALVGLGNPGPKYETTRHNAGFLIVDMLADEFGISMSTNKFDAEFGKGRMFGQDVVLAKPQTFMNLSGKSLGQIAAFYKIPEERIVVLHDDIDLESGKVKAKVGGGHGGHNGIRDILSKTPLKSFHRLKIGVGRPDKEKVHNWVLGQFSDDELKALESDVYDQVKIRLENIFKQIAA